MTDQESDTNNSVSNEDGRSLLTGLRRILMAGIGAAVLAQEEIEDFVTGLVDRGEIAENDGRSLISEVLERRKQTIQNNTNRVSDSVDRRVEGALNRLNVPSKSEITSLSEQIEELSKKVDSLQEID